LISKANFKLNIDKIGHRLQIFNENEYWGIIINLKITKPKPKHTSELKCKNKFHKYASSTNQDKSEISWALTLFNITDSPLPLKKP